MTTILDRTELWREVQKAVSDTEPVVLNSRKFVYVSQDGSDETGDGSQENPWKTVLYAVRQMPRVWDISAGGTNLCRYVVRVKAPYVGPLGRLSVSELDINGVSKFGLGVLVPALVIQHWTPEEEKIGEVDDPRFTVVAGPISASSVATFGGTGTTARKRYTLPGGTITSSEQWTGEHVRVFQGGVEVSRGVVVRSSSSTQELLVQQNTAYTAAASDTLYIVRPSVQLGGIAPACTTPTFSSISVSKTAEFLTPTAVFFEGIRFIDAVTISQGSLFVAGCQFVANGGSGAVATSSEGAIYCSSGGPADSQDVVPGGTSFFRSTAGTGFCGSGNLFLTNGSVLFGDWWGTSANGRGVLKLSSGSTWRGRAAVSGGGRITPIISMLGGTAASPVLLIPASVAGPMINPSGGVKLVLSGTIAVDAASCQGNLIQATEMEHISDGATAPVFVPADTGVTTMASGIVLNAVRDARIRGSVTSTLRGAGGVDVQAGTNTALTWAGLDAKAGDRDVDAANNATIIG